MALNIKTLDGLYIEMYIERKNPCKCFIYKGLNLFKYSERESNPHDFKVTGF